MSSSEQGEAAFANPEIDPTLSRERLAPGERLLDQKNPIEAFVKLRNVYDSEEKTTLTKGRAAREIAKAAHALYDSASTFTEHWQKKAVAYADDAFEIDDKIVRSQGIEVTADSLKERAASATLVGSYALKECIQLELGNPTLPVEATIPHIGIAQTDIARARELENNPSTDQYELDALQTWSIYESLHGDRAKGQAFALKALRTAHKAERDNANLNFLQKKRAQARYFVGALAAQQVNVLAGYGEKHKVFRILALKLAEAAV